MAKARHPACMRCRWWPMRRAVVLTDRPTVLRRDPEGRLHCEAGPAITYADGWSGHYRHGYPIARVDGRTP